MDTRFSTGCLLATLCLALTLGAGCTKKGVQATSEDEFLPGGSEAAASTGGGMPAGGGRGDLSEESLAGGSFEEPGGAGPGGFNEGDLGAGGSPGDPSRGAAGGQGPGGEAGEGGRFGDASGGFGGSGGFAPSGDPQGERGGVGAFPDVGGGGSPGSRGGQSFGAFEPIEPGQQTPLEDRLEQEGTMIAKADPSEAFESQVEDMRDERVNRIPEGFQDVFFGFDSWSISEEAKASLAKSAVWLKENPTASLTVEGHCDERGSAAYNLVLGEKRAKAVRHYLMELGVSPKRVTAVSYGEERPFCSDPTESCYQLNRRGHLVVR